MTNGPITPTVDRRIWGLWVAPIFCTRCYESMAWGFSAGGSPGATCSAVHIAANAAGVQYSNALCGRRWL